MRDSMAYRVSEPQRKALDMLCSGRLEYVVSPSPVAECGSEDDEHNKQEQKQEKEQGQKQRGRTSLSARVMAEAANAFRVEWALRNAALAPWTTCPENTADACALLLAQRRALFVDYGVCYITWEGALCFVAAPSASMQGKPRDRVLFVYTVDDSDACRVASVMFRPLVPVGGGTCGSGGGAPEVSWTPPECNPYAYTYHATDLFRALSEHGDQLVTGDLLDLCMSVPENEVFARLAEVIFGSS